MELLYLSNARLPSRSTNAMQVMRMCAAFQQAGAQVTLIHSVAANGLPEGYAGDLWSFYGVTPRFKLHRLPLSTAHQILRLRWLPPFLRLGSYSLALVNQLSCSSGSVLCYGRSLLGIWAMTLLRHMPGLASRCAGIYAELHDIPDDCRVLRMLSSVDGIVAISSALAREISTKLGKTQRRIMVEHDGVDLGTLSSTVTDSRLSICRRLDLSPEHPIAVYTGRVNRQKGAELLFETIALLRDTGCQFILVGKVYDPCYEALVSTPKWGHVRLTGFVPPTQVPDYLAAADVLLLPSTPELPYASYMSPLKLFEYMGAGRPMVASDLPVLREVLINEYNALLVSTDSPQAWADAISRLVLDPVLGQRLAQQARQDVERYTWARRAERIIGYMEDQA